jgi:nucleoside-diphosphate-sugar epimerase
MVENIVVDFLRELPINQVSGPVDAIVHLAQSQKFRDFPTESAEIFATNLRSTLGLLDWAQKKNVQHFIYASTGGVYADSARYLEASTPLKTPGELDFYFSTKLASEAFAQCYTSEFSVAIMRFFFVYGPNQNRKMLLPRVFDRVMQGGEVFLDGDDGFRLNPIHVSDAVQAIQASLENPQSLVTNVAGPEVLSLREASEIFGRHLGRAPRFVMTGKPVADVVGDTAFMFENLFRSTKKLGEMVGDLDH